MRVNRKKLELAMASACMTTKELAEASEMPRPSVTNVIIGRSVKPATLGRIARALGVEVSSIMEEEE